MNYLKITNKGLIVAEDLMLIGSSTKREQTGKIGMFGSGWKYALAYLIRNDATPIIFSGEKEIKIDFNIVLHRNSPVKVITVDGRETSLTTEMGPKWDAWMALREVYSNAIDEGDNTISTVLNPVLEGIEDETAIFIPLTYALQEVVMKFDMYFSFNRKVSFENKVARLFIRKEQAPITIYRKGIRCYNSSRYENCYFDIDFNEIPINEDRLASNIEYRIEEFIQAGITSDILKVLLAGDYTSFLTYSGKPSNSLIDNMKELLSQAHTFTTILIQKAGGIFCSKEDALVIPQT